MDKIHIHNLLNGVYNLLIRSTSGNTIDDPIIIEPTQKNDYIGTEYKIINLLCILSGFQWNCIEQTLHIKGEKKIDQLKIEIFGQISDQKIVVDYYFDITEPFKIFEGDVSDYLRENRNNVEKS